MKDLQNLTVLACTFMKLWSINSIKVKCSQFGQKVFGTWFCPSFRPWVHPSIQRSSWNWSIGFSGNLTDASGPCGSASDSWSFFLKKWICFKYEENGSKIEPFEFYENFWIIFWNWSQMKIHIIYCVIAQIP